MDKVLPIPVPATQAAHSTTIAYYQFSFLAYLLRSSLLLSITIIVTISPFTVIAYQAVLNMDANIQIMAQTLSNINSQVADIEKDVRTIRNDLDDVEATLGVIETSILALEASAVAIETTLNSMAVVVLEFNADFVAFVVDFTALAAVVDAIAAEVTLVSVDTTAIAATTAVLEATTAEIAVSVDAVLASSLGMAAGLAILVNGFVDPLLKLGKWEVDVKNTVDVKNPSLLGIKTPLKVEADQLEVWVTEKSGSGALSKVAILGMIDGAANPLPVTGVFTVDPKSNLTVAVSNWPIVPYPTPVIGVVSIDPTTNVSVSVSNWPKLTFPLPVTTNDRTTITSPIIDIPLPVTGVVTVNPKSNVSVVIQNYPDCFPVCPTRTPDPVEMSDWLAALPIIGLYGIANPSGLPLAMFQEEGSLIYGIRTYNDQSTVFHYFFDSHFPEISAPFADGRYRTLPTTLYIGPSKTQKATYFFEITDGIVTYAECLPALISPRFEDKYYTIVYVAKG